MTVKELIEVLQQQDQNLEVRLSMDNCGCVYGFSPLVSVYKEHDEKPRGTRCSDDFLVLANMEE